MSYLFLFLQVGKHLVKHEFNTYKTMLIGKGLPSSLISHYEPLRQCEFLVCQLWGIFLPCLGHFNISQGHFLGHFFNDGDISAKDGVIIILRL